MSSLFSNGLYNHQIPIQYFLDVDECEMLIIDVANLQQLFAIKTATYFRVPLNIFLL